jgi:hypothetical protein
MGTIDQPKPSEPKGIQPEQRPLQPGQTESGSAHDASPERVNYQTPDKNKGDTRNASQ